MQSSTRIDELRAKFHENPRRYFAPLANEYRKAGDPEQAIAICRAHLAQQPGHMSGHVVYAQALYDAKRTDEARTVFEQALALDPENVIVLRHLGDIARQRGETAEARHWYTRGLDSDPHDTEIAAYLAELTEPLGDGVPEGAPFVTRTMAELYVEQGYRAEALEVYRQLAVDRPDDREITDRIAELSAEPPAESAVTDRNDTAFAEPGDTLDDTTDEDRDSEAAGDFKPVDEALASASSSQTHFTETEMPGDGDSWDTDMWAAGFSSEESADFGDLDTPDVEPDAADVELDAAEANAFEPVEHTESDLVAYSPRAPEAFVVHRDADVSRGPTIREFFATLGARRPPFGDLFPGEAVSDEDSRAAFALSGAVGGPLLSSGQQDERAPTRNAGASPTSGSTAAAPSPSSADAGQESEEDIRKFREWLDGLAES